MGATCDLHFQARRLRHFALAALAGRGPCDLSRWLCRRASGPQAIAVLEVAKFAYRELESNPAVRPVHRLLAHQELKGGKGAVGTKEPTGKETES